MAFYRTVRCGQHGTVLYVLKQSIEPDFAVVAGVFEVLPTCEIFELG